MRYLSIFILLFLVASCSEEQIGQYPVDNTAPKPVSNPVVVNMDGKSKITYKLPDETDLLYVKATYTLDTGEKVEVKASSFYNSMIVDGFGRSAQHKVQLIAVDRSRNESSPVEVIVEPNDSPIYGLRETIEVVAGFGGIKLSWENPSKFTSVIGVMKKENGTFKHLETFYSSEPIALNKPVRGLDANPTEFCIYVRDFFNNYTDTMYLTLTPYPEELLDKKKFIGLPKSAKFTVSPYGTASLSVLWDGIVSDASAKGLYYLAAGSGNMPYIAFDLGQEAKLSRFRFWSRSDYYFRLHSPKLIAIYGTNDYTVANNPESLDDQWTFLVQGESYRPSGLTPNDMPTDEDLAYSKAGEEVEFPLDAPSVRYIRFKQLKSWTGTDGLTLAELTFWGSPVK